MSKIISVTAIGLAVNIALTSCQHEILIKTNQGETNGKPSFSTTCSSDTVYFTNTIQPLLNSSCGLTGCHDATSRKEGVELTSYANILATGGIKPGNPDDSKLYKMILRNDNERMPLPPNPELTAAQKQAIQKWILQGARNNSCNACDTAQFNYSASISPLINIYCKGCHNSSSASGGVDLSTHAAVQSQAVSGRLLGAIRHATGYSPMPKGGSKLSDCQIKQVEKWIAAGSLNN